MDVKDTSVEARDNGCDRHSGVAGEPVRSTVAQVVKRPVGPECRIGPHEHRPGRVIGQRPERPPQRPPQRVVARRWPLRHASAADTSRSHTNASGDAGSCCNARDPLRITVISCCPGSAPPHNAPSSSDARAPVEIQNATRARSRCEDSCANSWLNNSSGIRRGSRRVSRGRNSPVRCLPNGSPGRTGGLPRRSPLRTVRATRRGTRLKQAARACRPAVLIPCAGGLQVRDSTRRVRGVFEYRPVSPAPRSE